MKLFRIYFNIFFNIQKNDKKIKLMKHKDYFFFIIYFILLIRKGNNIKIKKDDFLNFLTQNEIGNLYELKDGPIENDAQRPDKPSEVNLIFSPGVKHLPLNNLRIYSRNVKIAYPNITEENIEEKLNSQKLTIEKDIINQENKDPSFNSYQEILRIENQTLLTDDKKNILELSLEKESDIYNNLIRDEVKQVINKEVNNGFFNYFYENNYNKKFNNINSRYIGEMKR